MKKQKQQKQKQHAQRPSTGRRYHKLGSLFWALQWLWSIEKRHLVLVCASIPVAVILPLVQSYFTGVLLDSIGAGASFSDFVVLCSGFTAAIILLNVLDNFLKNSCNARQYMATQMMQHRIDRVINSSAGDYENTEKQDFQELAGYALKDSSYGDCSTDFVWEDVKKLLVDALGILTYGSLLAVIDPRLFLVVAVVSVLSYFPTRWGTVYRENHKGEWEKEIRKVGYLKKLSEDFSRAKDIKLYGLDGWLNSMLRHYQDYILLWNKRCSLREVWAALLTGVFTLVQDGAAYLFLIALLLNGSIGVGDFVFYFGVVGSIAGFLTGIVADIAKLSDRADKIAYYRNVFDYPQTFNHGKGCAIPKGAVKIELKNVWFRYQGAKDYTLKGVNLTFQPGESLALVGMNGAGKSTLVKLICGMYAPTKGQILVNGKPIQEYNIEEYYTMISAVFQETRMVAFTIQEFITTSDPENPMAREQTIAALKQAGLWERVQRLPNGIDTHLMKGIYDDGVEFSGGEAQKLLLARAIYKNGSILVLDEPTAALDPIAENRLYLQYRDLTAGKTSLYISHRFASTRFCDRIVLLENGKITESGTHEELMRKNGQYAYLFGVQSKYYKEGEVHA